MASLCASGGFGGGKSLPRATATFSPPAKPSPRHGERFAARQNLPRATAAFSPPVASNTVEAVWCVEVDGFAAGAAVALSGLPEDYGTKDIYADANGKIYLWLPDGEYTLAAGGTQFTASVNGANTTAIGSGVSPAGLTAAQAAEVMASFKVDGDSVTFTVPLGAVNSVKFRASSSLSTLNDSSSIVAPASVTDNGDGTATVTIEKPSADASSMFYTLEGGAQ